MASRVDLVATLQSLCARLATFMVMRSRQETGPSCGRVPVSECRTPGESG